MCSVTTSSAHSYWYSVGVIADRAANGEYKKTPSRYSSISVSFL